MSLAHARICVVAARVACRFSMRREREGMTRNVFALHEAKWRLEAIGADRRNSCCGIVADTVGEARRTPSISASRNYVYKHVYFYFSAAWQARAVGSLESGNLVVYGPLNSGRISAIPTQPSQFTYSNFPTAAFDAHVTQDNFFRIAYIHCHKGVICRRAVGYSQKVQ